MPHSKIATLTVSGLRGLSGTFNLSDPLYVTGRHGGGKTSLLDAVRFLALGYIPSLGRTEAATSKAMIDREVRVQAVLADGRVMERALTRVRGRLSSDAFASWVSSAATRTEHSEAILGVFGADSRDVEENLYLPTLLGASSQQRAKRLEEILDASSIPLADLMADVKALTVGRLVGETAESVLDAAVPRSARSSLAEARLGTLPDDQRIAVRTLCDDVAGHLSGGQTVADVIANIGMRRSSLDLLLKSRAAARQELETRLAGAPDVSDSLDDLTRQRQARTDRIAVLKDRASAYEQALDLRQEAAVRLERATLAQDASQHRLSQLASEAEAVLQEPVLDEPEPFAPPPGEPGALIEARRRYEGLLAELQKAPVPRLTTVRPNQAGVREAMRVVANWRADIDAAAGDPWIEVAAIAERLATLNLADAPRLAELARQNAPLVDVMRQRLEAAEAELARERAAYAAACEDFDRAEKEQAAVEAKHNELRSAVSAAKAELDQRIADHASEVNQHTRRENARLSAARAAIRAQQARFTEARTTLAKCEFELEELRSAVAEAKAECGSISIDSWDPGAAAEELVRLEGEAADLARRMEALLTAVARRQEMADIVRAIESSMAQLEATKAVEWALQRCRERDLGQRGEPIIARMRAFLRAAGRTEEPFFASNAGSVDFGWIDGAGRSISVASLSGAEAVLFQAALSTAIVSLRQPDLRVLLMEGSEAGEFLPQITAGVLALKDDLDNVVLATWVRPAQAPEGWRLKVI